MEITDYLYSAMGNTPYGDVLPRVQRHMSQNYAELFSRQTLSNEDIFLIKKNIENFLIDEGISCGECKNLTDLTERVYKDMVMYSFLTDYLQPAKIEELGLEEININSWESVFIKTAKHGKLRLEERFLSPQHAADVVTRMLRHSGMVMDDAKPVALGHLAKNIRIAGFKTPLLDEEIGVSGSIRVVSFSKLSRNNLIRQYGTIPEDAMEFLELCIRYGISICVAGATGSGKTGTAGYLLSTVCADASTRVITVEEGSREFDLIRRDEGGRVCNDVVHLLTRESENAAQNIDQDYLLEHLLRYDPDVIGVGEMRSHEAITAAEASLTDHTVITTTHCRSAAGAYKRMVTLAKKASGSDDETLYDMMVDAFPIVVYQKQFRDKGRRVSEIIEGEAVEGKQVRYRTLWSYEVSDTYIDEAGAVRLTGQFVKGQKISDGLRKRLSDNGVPQTLLQRY